MGAQTSAGEGKLTTHVLDTAAGRSAAGVRIELFRLSGPGREKLGPNKLAEVATNQDGRCEAPLLAGADMRPGTYELVFHVAAYFRGADVTLTEPPFLDQVPIRFGISEARAHYHVPLLISPYGYATYRGS